VEKYYPVVGVLEELNATLEVLEHEIPYYFKGVENMYKKKMIGRFVVCLFLLINDRSIFQTHSIVKKVSNRKPQHGSA
jgi:hypothetical protein